VRGKVNVEALSLPFVIGKNVYVAGRGKGILLMANRWR